MWDCQAVVVEGGTAGEELGVYGSREGSNLRSGITHFHLQMNEQIQLYSLRGDQLIQPILSPLFCSWARLEVTHTQYFINLPSA